MKGQSFTGVGHDLRTRIALVLEPSERLLGSDALDDASRADLELIVGSANSLLTYLSDLLDPLELERQSEDEVAPSRDAARASVPDSSRSCGASVAPREGPALVLVIDDDVVMNRLIAESLADDYQVVTAFDADSGIATAVDLVPDAILASVSLPGFGAEGLVHEIRSFPKLNGVPIIVLMSKAEDAHRRRFLQRGAEDYLLKPCTPEETRARVKTHVTVKRAREALQLCLDSTRDDLEILAYEASEKKRDLEAALEATSQARDRADRMCRSKSDFLGLVSHELRTPLTAIRLQLDRAIHHRESLSPTHHAIVNRMEVSCARMMGLVETLLEHARIQGGKLAIERERFAVETIVSEALDELQIQAQHKGLSLEFDAAGQHVIDSDPHVLGLVVSNLVQNAIKFTSVGTVSVSVTDQAGSVAIAVRDSGPGIAPTEHARIFEPFEQLEALSNKHKAGVGLGLALVREMLPLLEGSVTLESQPGMGSVFTVTLPVAPTGNRPHSLAAGGALRTSALS